MERRDFLTKGAALAATTMAASAVGRMAFAAEGAKKKNEHAGHQMHSHSGPGAKEKALMNAASDCAMKSDACLQHCLDMLATGDTSLANCAKTVRETMVYCNALAQAAAQNSKRLKELAKIALDACNECEEACRKHAKEHVTCKECADSCAECAKLCKALLA